MFTTVMRNKLLILSYIMQVPEHYGPGWGGLRN